MQRDPTLRVQLVDDNRVKLLVFNERELCPLDVRRAHNGCDSKIAKVEVGVQATDAHPQQMIMVEWKAVSGARRLISRIRRPCLVFVASPTHEQSRRAEYNKCRAAAHSRL